MKISLYTQLFLLTLASVGSLGLVVYHMEISTSLQNRTYTQQAMRERAPVYAAELASALGSNFDETRLREILLHLQSEHPLYDFYILDHDGVIRLHFPDPLLPPGAQRKLQTSVVDIAPVQALLSGAKLPQGGIIGTDPYDPPARRLFIAHPVSLGNGQGYLYIVLNKPRDRAGFLFKHSPWYYPWIAVIGSLIVILWILNLVFFVKPVRSIAQTLEQITAGALDKRVKSFGSKELSLIGERINQMADTISQNLAQLDEKDARRRELIANISHDLRGPLTALRTTAEAALETLDTSATNEQEKKLKTIIRNAEMLGVFVAQLFELSTLDAKETQPIMEPFSVLDMVTEEIIPKYAEIARNNGVRLIAEIPESAPRVLADFHMIYRVLSNLVENALRWTGANGTVKISAELLNDKIRISVADTGCGIAAANLPFIFERFYRTDHRERGKASGMGLGLAIVKKIIELHEAAITVESTEGEGSTFTFLLPVYREGQ